MLSHGVQKIFIHSGASGAVNEPNFECALFDYGGAPRKLLPGLAVLTQLLGPSPVCVGTRTVGKGAQVAGFETGRQAVLLLWQPEDEAAREVALSAGGDLTWLDAMGRRLDGPPARLPSSLTYLLARSGKATEMLGKLVQD